MRTIFGHQINRLQLMILICAVVVLIAASVVVVSVETAHISNTTGNTSSSTTVTSGVTTTSTGPPLPLRLLVPLYVDPTDGTVWVQMINFTLDNPGVRVDAIINPDNGPGNFQSQSYVSGVEMLQAAGITVLGYVYTSYGSRATSAIMSDIQSYKNWYNVSGIFLDEMSLSASDSDYYSSITSQAHALGLYPVIGNPGTNVSQSLVTSVDNTVIYESAGVPQASLVCASTDGLSGKLFSVIAYGVGTMPSAAYLQSIRGCVNYVYFTNQNGPGIYSGLPTYFSTEIGEVATVDNTV